MSASFEQAALLGAGSSGAHQQILGTIHGSGSGDTNPPVAPVIESNFRDGVYKINGSAVTLADVWEENADWWAPWTYAITPGLGYVKADDGSPTYATSDSGSPALKHGLFGSTINLDDGFTVLLEGSFVYALQGGDDENTASFSTNIGLQIADFPDYSSYRDGSVTANLSKQNGAIGVSGYHSQYDDADLTVGDDTTLGASPQVMRLAITFEAERVAFSLNGRTVQVAAPAAMETPPTDIGLTYGLLSTLTQVTSALEYVAFYPKFANDADLMTLTAP